MTVEDVCGQLIELLQLFSARFWRCNRRRSRIDGTAELRVGDAVSEDRIPVVGLGPYLALAQSALPGLEVRTAGGTKSACLQCPNVGRHEKLTP